MVSYKKILFLILFLGLLCVCSPVFAGNSTQLWSLDSYSPTFDNTYPDFARSTKFIIFPNFAIIFPRDKNVDDPSCFVIMTDTYIKLSDDSNFIVVPISNKSSGFPNPNKYVDFSNASLVSNFYPTNFNWQTISYSSVPIRPNSTYSTVNLRTGGVGIFMGSNTLGNTNFDYFSRYTYLEGVFEYGYTLYYKESYGVSVIDTTITISAYKDGVREQLVSVPLSEWYYDDYSKVYYYNISDVVYNTIINRDYHYFLVSATHELYSSNQIRNTYIYMANSSQATGGGSGGGSGGSGGSTNIAPIIDSMGQMQNTLDDINSGVGSVDNSINEQTNFLKSDTISDSNMTLPSDSTQDITQSGINNIFTLIYNGFTSGQAVDIVLPIPFTNKNITIPANYTYNILHGNTAFSVIYSLIQAFYWYFISVFIVSDISKKITKIKGGNLENIANSNIKEEML